MSHNTSELLRECLCSVISNQYSVCSIQRAINSPLNTEHCSLNTGVVVVDNASTDDSAEMVATEFPAVALYRSETNLGYGAAANRAIAACHSPYVLLLNSDTLLQPGALPALETYLDEHSQVAMVGPRYFNANGKLQPSCFPFPTPLDIFLDVTHAYDLIAHVPFLREKVMRTWAHDRPRRVPWVLGAALAIRRAAFQAVGGFDDSFFMYYEEADLCYRLAQAGCETHFAPVTDIVHIGGASTQQQRADMIVQLYASLAQFYRRHYSRVRQVELAMLVSSVAFARLIRDSLAIGFTRDQNERAVDIHAWRRLLAGEWQTLGN